MLESSNATSILPAPCPTPSTSRVNGSKPRDRRHHRASLHSSPLARHDPPAAVPGIELQYRATLPLAAIEGPPDASQRASPTILPPRVRANTRAPEIAASSSSPTTQMSLATESGDRSGDSMSVSDAACRAPALSNRPQSPPGSPPADGTASHIKLRVLDR
jgi:hypothetical protein